MKRDNMKKLLCVALLVPSVAFAAANKPSTAEGYYGRVDLGLDMRKDNKTSVFGSDIKIKKNKTAVLGFGLGYKFNEYFRSDLNLQFRNLKTESKDFTPAIKNTAFTTMLNGFVDLPTGTMFTPYGVVGVGMSNIKKADNTLLAVSGNHITFKTKNKTSFAWNAGLGVNTKIQDSVSLDLGYKFVNVGKIKFKVADTSKTSKIQAHELAAGVIFSF
jgi:outer membrane immunogenic protein